MSEPIDRTNDPHTRAQPTCADYGHPGCPICDDVDWTTMPSGPEDEWCTVTVDACAWCGRRRGQVHVESCRGLELSRAARYQASVDACENCYASGPCELHAHGPDGPDTIACGECGQEIPRSEKRDHRCSQTEAWTKLRLERLRRLLVTFDRKPPYLDNTAIRILIWADRGFRGEP